MASQTAAAPKNAGLPSICAYICGPIAAIAAAHAVPPCALMSEASDPFTAEAFCTGVCTGGGAIEALTCACRRICCNSAWFAPPSRLIAFNPPAAWFCACTSDASSGLADAAACAAAALPPNAASAPGNAPVDCELGASPE